MKSDRHTLESHHTHQFSYTVSFAEEEPQNSNCQYKGLVFHQDNGIAAEDDALQALTAIAQVCCFLGLALTHHSTRSSRTNTLSKLHLLICITALCLYMYQIEVAACPRTSSLQARFHCIRVGQHARYIQPWLSYNWYSTLSETSTDTVCAHVRNVSCHCLHTSQKCQMTTSVQKSETGRLVITPLATVPLSCKAVMPLLGTSYWRELRCGVHRHAPLSGA